SSSTVGMWLLTSTAVWWCADIMAETPVWDDVLTLATVQASDAPSDNGAVEFKCMGNYASAPGYLIVATGPDSEQFTTSYPHAYFWHTHDYGANWTQVDMDEYLFTNAALTRGYCGAGSFALEIFRSSPGTIWCVRQAPRAGTQGRTAVFVSEDLGNTWEKRYEWEAPTMESDGASFLHPFPSATDPSYVMRSNTAAAQRPQLYR